MRTTRMLALLVLAAALPAPGAGQTIGLTQGAEAAIAMPASIVVGTAKIAWVKGADGAYRPRYEDQTPLTIEPSDDGSARKAKLAAEIAALARFADADGSGNVTTEEGLTFRQTLEFGLGAAAVGAKEKTSDPAKVAALLGLTAEQYGKRLAAYNDLRARMKGHAADVFRPSETAPARARPGRPGKRNETMKRKRTFGALVALALVLAVCGPLAAKTDEQKAKDAQEARAKIDRMAQQKLDEVLAANPKAKALLDKAFGYAVFDNTKLALGIGGGGSGKGVAVERASGKRTYMRMQAAGVGLGVGAQTYNVVFLFEDEKTFRSFVDKGWTAESSASAVAGDQGAGAGDSFVQGMAVYVLTDKGLMARADVTGTKYWKNDKLNEN